MCHASPLCNSRRMDLRSKALAVKKRPEGITPFRSRWNGRSWGESMATVCVATALRKPGNEIAHVCTVCGVDVGNNGQRIDAAFRVGKRLAVLPRLLTVLPSLSADRQVDLVADVTTGASFGEL
jgi:NADH:ubiquinone oxidoreductase subunit C